VVDGEGRYAGVLTVDDFMKELSRLCRDACDKPGNKDWVETFFNQCELVGIKKVSEIMSGGRLSIGTGKSFERACELILYKKLNLVIPKPSTSGGGPGEVLPIRGKIK